MAYTDINPEVVAEISNLVGQTLDNINGKFDNFQTTVLNKLEEHWYNDNAKRVCPIAASTLTKINSSTNTSLASLGSALGSAAQAWAQANGAPGYDVKKISANNRTLKCDAQPSKGGHEGMETEEIQTAINSAESLKGEMLNELKTLKAAGQREGFRGGNMQANLNSVCDTLESQINKAINEIIDNITTNTGTAKGNVESAKSSTEATFTIS